MLQFGRRRTIIDLIYYKNSELRSRLLYQCRELATIHNP